MVTFMMLYFVILKLNDIIKLKKWPKIFKKKKDHCVPWGKKNSHSGLKLQKDE